MRQRLEAHPRRRLAGIGVVGNEVPPPHLGGIDAQLRRRLVDHVLGHRDGDWMSHGAVLAHHVLVLEHHRPLGAVLLVLVRSSREIEDLVALDPGGAREHRVRPDAGEIVDLEGRHVAVAVDGELRLHAVVARVDVREEGLVAVAPVGKRRKHLR